MTNSELTLSGSDIVAENKATLDFEIERVTLEVRKIRQSPIRRVLQKRKWSNLTDELVHLIYQRQHEYEKWEQQPVESHSLFNDPNVLFVHSPGAYLYGALEDHQKGEKEIRFNPKFENEIQGEARKFSFTVKAYIINLVDWVMLKRAAERETSVDPCEIDYTSYEFSFLTAEELDQLTIPYCDAGPYVEMGNTYTKGNHYHTDQDTYGSLYGSYASDLWFFYREDINKYGVIKRKYLEL